VKIAILGWGSLLWDKRPEFDNYHDDWQSNGPRLHIEYSRISETRNGVLTLVLDAQHGSECQVAYALSKRKNPDDAICDLRSREGTTLKNIGFYFADNSRNQARDPKVLEIIKSWASRNKIDVVVWTDLKSNFKVKSRDKELFSVKAALRHIQALDEKVKAKAAEYVWRSPSFVVTPLREKLQSQPWFKK
jgi:hypothetical protein